MKKVALILGLFLVFFGAGFVSAQCSVSVSASDTAGLIQEVSTLDSQFQNCPQALPFPLSTLFGNQVVVLEIALENGNTQNIYFETSGGALSGVSLSGTGTGYTIGITQCGLDTALREDDFAVYGQLWDAGDLTLRATGFLKKMLLGAARPFIGGALGTPATPYTISCSQNAALANPAAVATGKPDNCDETYIQGHQGYAENQALWDSHSADTDGVCQSQYGSGIPSPCVHTVQLSISGNPYYLCWYNE